MAAQRRRARASATLDAAVLADIEAAPRADAFGAAVDLLAGLPSRRRETLHALVVDDACGQLPGEVSELLGAWLAVEPEDAREARGILSAVQLACTACRSAADPASLRPRRPASPRPTRQGRVCA